jgi:hypothetical protein
MATSYVGHPSLLSVANGVLFGFERSRALEGGRRLRLTRDPGDFTEIAIEAMDNHGRPVRHPHNVVLLLADADVLWLRKTLLEIITTHENLDRTRPFGPGTILRTKKTVSRVDGSETTEISVEREERSRAGRTERIVERRIAFGKVEALWLDANLDEPLLLRLDAEPEDVEPRVRRTPVKLKGALRTSRIGS